MLERIDWQEIKKLGLFLAVVILVTAVIGLVGKGINGVRLNDIRQKSHKSYKLATDSEEEKQNPLDIKNYEIYQARDPFMPLALPDDAQIEGNLAANASKPVPKVAKVYSENRVEKALIIYHGKHMTVKEGKKIGGFKVVDIRKSDKRVVFLYGDERVTVKAKSLPKPKRR